MIKCETCGTWYNNGAAHSHDAHKTVNEYIEMRNEINDLRRKAKYEADVFTVVLEERDRYRKALESAPEPTMIDPETQQPQLRTDMYRNPVPEDRRYAEWYGDEREPALKGDES